MIENILMIHGMWGGGWYWENFKKYFEARGYTCLTPTLRYHDIDPSNIPDQRLGTTSLLDYAEDLKQIILSLNSIPILVGHTGRVSCEANCVMENRKC